MKVTPGPLVNWPPLMSVKLQRSLDWGLLRVTAGVRLKERKKKREKERKQVGSTIEQIISLVLSSALLCCVLFVCEQCDEQHAFVNVYSLRAAPVLLTIPDIMQKAAAIWLKILSYLLFYTRICRLSTSRIQRSTLAAAGLFLTNKSNKQSKENRKMSCLSFFFYLSLMI